MNNLQKKYFSKKAQSSGQFNVQSCIEGAISLSSMVHFYDSLYSSDTMHPISPTKALAFSSILWMFWSIAMARSWSPLLCSKNLSSDLSRYCSRSLLHGVSQVTLLCSTVAPKGQTQ